jgi:hypothetical protein
MSSKKPDSHLIFRIDSFTPDTIPMARLAEYMTDLAKLYGHRDSVHFVQLKKGSACIESKVDLPDIPKVQARLHSLNSGDVEQETLRAYKALDQKLAEDNATGRLTGYAGKNVIQFPGRDRIVPKSYGPIVKESSLDGLLIDIGGKDKTVSLRIQLGETTYSHIETDRTIAKKMCSYLFEPLRIFGRSKWMREPDGVWTLKHFKVTSFSVLDRGSFQDALEDLRKIPGSHWKDIGDPLIELAHIRGNEVN